MSNERVAPETKGVTVTVLATVDLAREIEGMAGHQLRMRMVTIEPGGAFGPIHFDPPHRIEPARVAASLRALWDRAETAMPSQVQAGEVESAARS